MAGCRGRVTRAWASLYSFGAGHQSKIAGKNVKDNLDGRSSENQFDRFEGGRFRINEVGRIVRASYTIISNHLS